MRFDCNEAREHIDAWALGALDADDAGAFEAHLASCAECTMLADAARDTASSLAMAVPLRSSSAALKSRVMAAARVLSLSEPSGGARWWRTAAASAAVLAVSAVAWGGYAEWRANDLANDRSSLQAAATAQSGQLVALRTQVVAGNEDVDALGRLIDTQNSVLDVALRPDVEWTELSGTPLAPGATARCVWSRTQALGAFIAENLPLPPEGMAYQVWLVYERSWLNGGSFDVDADGRGRLVMHKIWGDRDSGRLLGFAVTVEQKQQNELPSGDLVMASSELH